MSSPIAGQHGFVALAQELPQHGINIKLGGKCQYGLEKIIVYS
jgi:hypothetical protein